MYKLLVVDDEEIEREGMTRFIDWDKYGVRLVGAAWNGVEALEMIERLRPDIVITDMKMPVMDGIELIRRARENFPAVIFIVLSGYGDYEFTSRAMEEGIQYYVLKPCDESRIAEVLQKVTQKLDEKNRTEAARQAYEREVDRLLPLARKQLFRELLLSGGEARSACRTLSGALGGEVGPVRLLAVRLPGGFDEMEAFVIGNMLRDLLPSGALLLETDIREDVLLLVRDGAMENFDWAAARLRREFARFAADPLGMALSRAGAFEAVGRSYEETQALLRAAGRPAADAPLWRQENLPERDAAGAFDYRALRAAGSYEAAVRELAFARCCLRRAGKENGAVRDACALALRLAFGGQPALPEDTGAAAFLQAGADHAAAALGLTEGENDRRLLAACYNALCVPGTGVASLAHNELFVSEGYFSRKFSALTGRKFTAWLETARIELAQRLICAEPGIRIGELAECVGYAPDGQYFSKAFRKVAGVTPSEYRDSLGRDG